MRKNAKKKQESNIIYNNNNDSQIKQRRDYEDRILKKMESQVAKFFIERETRAKLWNLGLLF